MIGASSDSSRSRLFLDDYKSLLVSESFTSYNASKASYNVSTLEDLTMSSKS